MAGLLADRGFRRLLVGQSISNFGDTCLYLSLGIWAKDLTGSNSAAGGVFLAISACGAPEDKGKTPSGARASCASDSECVITNQSGCCAACPKRMRRPETGF